MKIKLKCKLNKHIIATEKLPHQLITNSKITFQFNNKLVDITDLYFIDDHYESKSIDNFLENATMFTDEFIEFDYSEIDEVFEVLKFEHSQVETNKIKKDLELNYNVAKEFFDRELPDHKLETLENFYNSIDFNSHVYTYNKYPKVLHTEFYTKDEIDYIFKLEITISNGNNGFIFETSKYDMNTKIFFLNTWKYLNTNRKIKGSTLLKKIRNCLVNGVNEYNYKNEKIKIEQELKRKDDEWVTKYTDLWNGSDYGTSYQKYGRDTRVIQVDKHLVSKTNDNLNIVTLKDLSNEQVTEIFKLLSK